MALLLDTYGATDVGLKREHNEDFFYVDDALGLYIVADGMGGHAAGEVASHAAIETIGNFVASAQRDRDFTWPFGIDKNLTTEENLLLSAVKLANGEICGLAESKAEYNGMGTTVVGLKTDDGGFVAAHVGDSRLYRYRDDKLDLLTSDHSWVNEQVARSLITEEEARTHRWRNVITRALGNKYTIDVDISRTAVETGDVFLLCTDGLNGMIADQEIHRILRASAESAEIATRRLIQRANEAGGHDNITVLVIRVLGEGKSGKTSDVEPRITGDVVAATQAIPPDGVSELPPDPTMA